MHNKKQIKNKGLRQMPLAQILEIFSQIDLKIIDLHKCSSDDFLSLNSALKDNYKKASVITDKTHYAFEQIGKSGNLNSINLSKQEVLKLYKQVNNIEQKIDTSLEKLENVVANLNMMPIPLNNFIQNLCVLKLLFSNIKLTNSFFDNPDNYFNISESKKIEDTIDKIKQDCQPLEENFSVIHANIKALFEILYDLKNTKLGSIYQNIEKIQTNLDVIEKYNINALKNYDQVNILSKQCSDNVESIITNLQYHDIIRQKMEHIQKSHKLIIGELNGLDKKEVLSEGEDKDKLMSYVNQIPQISEIQTAQLLHANKEFQNAIDQITGKMNEIGQNMQQTARIYNSMSAFKHQGDEVNTDAIDLAFSNNNKNFSNCNSIIEKLNQKLSSISNLILHLKENIINADLLDNSIERLVVEKINDSKLLISSSKETATQAQQLLKIYADNRFEKSKLKDLFKHTIENIAQVQININHLSKIQHGISALKGTSDKAYNKIINIKDVFKHLKESNELIQHNSKEILQQNKNAIKDTKYYKYFEESIDEIIENFNKIRSIVKNEKFINLEDSSDENSLKQLEEYYTMKTERVIHNQTLTSILESNNEAVDNDDDNQGNDVEFF